MVLPGVTPGPECYPYCIPPPCADYIDLAGVCVDNCRVNLGIYGDDRANP